MEELNNKKRDCSGLNVALKTKLETLKNLEKEMYQKYINLEEKSTHKMASLDNEFLVRNRERLELEANNRLAELDLKNETINNQELEFILSNNQKLEELKQQEFEKQLEIIEQNTKEKINEYELVNGKIVYTPI